MATTAGTTGTATTAAARRATGDAWRRPSWRSGWGRNGPTPWTPTGSIEVPDGAASLTASLTDVDALIELLIRPAGESWAAFDRSRGGSERSATVESPAPGPHYIDIGPAISGAASPFTLEVTVG